MAVVSTINPLKTPPGRVDVDVVVVVVVVVVGGGGGGGGFGPCLMGVLQLE